MHELTSRLAHNFIAYPLFNLYTAPACYSLAITVPDPDFSYLSKNRG